MNHPQIDDGNLTQLAYRRMLQDLHDIGSADIELARLAVSIPWYVDGTTYHEAITLRGLGNIAAADVDLARLIANFTWFAEGSFDARNASVALTLLASIASKDAEFAKTIAESWLTDGISSHEANSLEPLNELASRDLEFAKQLAVLSWLTDDVTEAEEAALWLLDRVDALDTELARKMTGESWFAEKGALSSYVLNSLNSFLHRDTDALRELTGQPWFTDGLDEEEAAFVVTLAWVAARNPALYTDLLRTRYTQNRAISLPLAGNVNIWIFQNTPFPADEDLLTVVADTARIAEGLLQVPFPTNDIILLVVDDTDRRYNFNYGKHLSSFLVVTRRPTGLRSIRHETAHYYSNLGPQWLVEGGTEFIAAYVRDRTGVQSLSDRKIEASQQVQSDCFELNEIENIRHLSYVWGRTNHVCPYVMGENLLFNLSEVLGEDALASALAELYRLPLGEGTEREKEDLVFSTLAQQVPTGRMEEFRDLYRRLHGGPYQDPGVDRSDDHGNESAAATRVTVGEVVEGSLDYHFDFDYFLFHAEEGQQYVISVNHDTLRASSLLLYGGDGQTFERFTDRGRGSSGPRMQWTAPTSGDYYFAVHNFGGKSGRYTAAITRQGSGS